VIRVVLPAHLRTLARISGELELPVDGRVTPRAIVDAIEERYPALSGTIRDATTKKRRPYIRYFACERDLSHDSPDEPLPERVASGNEPFLIVGAIAGG
jgi:molybdopterin synthase sulfur carrier subunit